LKSLWKRNPQQRALDFRAFSKKRARSRLLVIILYSIFQQWNGGGIICQYLVPDLEAVGIDKPIYQLGVNFRSNATYLIFTVCKAFVVDRFNRRILVFAGLISFIVLQIAATIVS
jgi:hypothetical protein